MSIIPPLRKLTGLQQLKLLGNPFVLADGFNGEKLLTLTTMTSLQYLDVLDIGHFPGADVERFWKLLNQAKEGRGKSY